MKIDELVLLLCRIGSNMQYVLEHLDDVDIEVDSIEDDNYLDHSAPEALQPGYAVHMKTSLAACALIEFGLDDPTVVAALEGAHKLRYIEHRPAWRAEHRLLVAMLRWDWFNKLFKFGVLQRQLDSAGTSVDEATALAERRTARLLHVGRSVEQAHIIVERNMQQLMAAMHNPEMATLASSCPLFADNKRNLAALRIQRWWLRARPHTVTTVVESYLGAGLEGCLGLGRFSKLSTRVLLRVQESKMRSVTRQRIVCARSLARSLVDRLMECFRGPTCDTGPRGDMGGHSRTPQ